MGTFFKICFGSLYENTETFSTIPTAVVTISENEIFKSVMDSVEASDNPLFKATYTDEEKALSLLEESQIKGIIYVNANELSLTVSSSGVAQTVIKSFLEQYKTQESLITQTIMTSPENTQAVIDTLSSDVLATNKIRLTDGNADPYVSYFYNLIAMVALFGSITGLHVSVFSQGNMSAIGARRCCSPTPKVISLFAGLLGSFIIQAICVSIAVTYTVFVLKVDFGASPPLIYASAIFGGILGVSMGFMVGSFGSMSENIKTSISFAVSMICCFFSGLMVGDMKTLVEHKAPWFNRINPAALISDSLYCLNVYSDYRRYTEKMLSMAVLSAIFITVGFFMTRRRKYASL